MSCKITQHDNISIKAQWTEAPTCSQKRKKQKTVQLSWDPVVGKNKGLYEDMLSTLEVKNNAPLPTVHLKITSPVLKDPGRAKT